MYLNVLSSDLFSVLCLCFAGFFFEGFERRGRQKKKKKKKKSHIKERKKKKKKKKKKKNKEKLAIIFSVKRVVAKISVTFCFTLLSNSSNFENETQLQLNIAATFPTSLG